MCKLGIAAAKSLQSCPTLCDPIDGSLPGSSVRGIFQARVLEWGAIAVSENSSRKIKKREKLNSHVHFKNPDKYQLKC